MMLNLNDYQQEAKKILPKMVYDYYSSGARDQITLRQNTQSFEDISLIFRVLVNVSKIDTGINFYGHQLPSPIMIAPTAMHKLADEDGEISTAIAASETNTLMGLSSLSTTSLEDVSQVPGPKIFQLYVLKDRVLTESLVKQAERCGYLAIAVTVDAPVLGTRESDVRNQFSLPKGLKLPHYDSELNSDGGSGLEEFFLKNLDSSLIWEDIYWLKKISSLPILLKGVVSPIDAQLAVHHGFDGIIVSNHGARQLDTSLATIKCLPMVAESVRGRIPIYFDGGIRRGTDVLKALALGANGVFIGRPVLFGLAVGGSDGVKDVLRILNDELVQSMKLCGTPSIDSITEQIVYNPVPKL
eukprot:TRINITY_DN1960_c0_g1_i1.p1 TRINITY_DN1960_c0_g1~~TRINITY_DN1960_c0_g1_i1.p1  ORF type:complete len:356 (+),score=71.57 TRINITY_DN1960_c0_g1_i1:187-1254(+)